MNKQVNIEVFGTSTAGEQLVLASLKEHMLAANIPCTIREVTDVSVFIHEKLSSVPAIKFDDRIIELQKNGSFNNSLRYALSQILKSRNYGDMKKILIPVDFSDVSSNAFMYGLRLASVNKNNIIKAIHVYKPSAAELLDVSAIELEQKHKTKLNDFVAHFDREWGADLLTTSFIDAELKTGFPTEAILESSKNDGKELIIMGMTGETTNIKKWLGSVSTSVMSHAECPVLLIPIHAQYKGVKNIMYAYNDLELDKKVAAQVIAFALPLGAKVHLIHVANDDHSIDANELVSIYHKELGTDAVISEKIKANDIPNTLNTYAQHYEIDVIAMGVKQKSIWQKIYQKSISNEMSYESKTPLLIVK